VVRVVRVACGHRKGKENKKSKGRKGEESCEGEGDVMQLPSATLRRPSIHSVQDRALLRSR
jgi:hypothetical protein